MISEQLREQINQAMKEGDDTRVSTLKLLLNAFNNAEIDNKRQKLTDEQELEIVRAEAKKRKDAIEAFEKAGRDDRAQEEKKELNILNEFLPPDLTREEIEELVEEGISETGASSKSDMGRVMGYVMGKTGGRADGNEVRKLVEDKLS